MQENSAEKPAIWNRLSGLRIMKKHLRGRLLRPSGTSMCRAAGMTPEITGDIPLRRQRRWHICCMRISFSRRLFLRA